MARDFEPNGSEGHGVESPPIPDYLDPNVIPVFSQADIKDLIRDNKEYISLVDPEDASSKDKNDTRVIAKVYENSILELLLTKKESMYAEEDSVDRIKRPQNQYLTFEQAKDILVGKGVGQFDSDQINLDIFRQAFYAVAIQVKSKDLTKGHPESAGDASYRRRNPMQTLSPNETPTLAEHISDDDSVSTEYKINDMQQERFIVPAGSSLEIQNNSSKEHWIVRGYYFNRKGELQVRVVNEMGDNKAVSIQEFFLLKSGFRSIEDFKNN